MIHRTNSFSADLRDEDVSITVNDFPTAHSFACVPPCLTGPCGRSGFVRSSLPVCQRAVCSAQQPGRGSARQTPSRPQGRPAGELRRQRPEQQAPALSAHNIARLTEPGGFGRLSAAFLAAAVVTLSPADALADGCVASPSGRISISIRPGTRGTWSVQDRDTLPRCCCSPKVRRLCRDSITNAVEAQASRPGSHPGAPHTERHRQSSCVRCPALCYHAHAGRPPGKRLSRRPVAQL